MVAVVVPLIPPKDRKTKRKRMSKNKRKHTMPITIGKNAVDAAPPAAAAVAPPAPFAAVPDEIPAAAVSVCAALLAAVIA